MWAIAPLLATVVLPGMRVAQQRPTLSGPEQLVEVDGFRIHWTDEGADAPSDDDDDGNGLPDTIDAFLAGLQGGRTSFEEEGWRPLIGDDGAGGSTDIDVYVLDIDIFGYATTWPSESGDGWSCFIQLDAGTSTAGGVAESVALHELHHCVQYRYTAQTDSWLYEAAATYEQYTHVVDPVLDLAMGVLYGTRLQESERPLGDVGGRFEYAGALFVKFWSEWRGFEPERLPALWEALATEPDWPSAFEDEAHRVWGVGFDRVFLEHATWNAFACANDDGHHYRADVLPCIATVSVPFEPAGDGSWSVTHDEGPFTAAYLQLDDPTGATALACAGADGAALLALDAEGQMIGTSSTLEGEPLQAPMADTVRAIVVGTNAPLDADCALVPSRASHATSGCATTPVPGPAWLLVMVPLLVSRRSAPRARRRRHDCRRRGT